VNALTQDAVFKCAHMGVVDVAPTQDFVRVDGRLLLIDHDPEGRDIDRCPNNNPPAGQKRCNKTLKVNVGYSAFISIDGHAVCLDNLWGFTDGTPPGAVKYTVRRPGQEFVAAGS
jgi:hypothetical protein